MRIFPTRYGPRTERLLLHDATSPIARATPKVSDRDYLDAIGLAKDDRVPKAARQHPAKPVAEGPTGRRMRCGKCERALNLVEEILTEAQPLPLIESCGRHHLARGSRVKPCGVGWLGSRRFGIRADHPLERRMA